MKKLQDFWQAICRKWCKYRANWKERQYNRVHRQAVRESRRAVQVREFNDEVYICLNGVPMLTEADTKADILMALTAARRNYVFYKISQYE